MAWCFCDKTEIKTKKYGRFVYKKNRSGDKIATINMQK